MMTAGQSGPSESVMDKVLAEVMKRIIGQEPGEEHGQSRHPPVEFVGTAAGDTIGLVIANADASLFACMGLNTTQQSLGIIGARTGSHTHVMAADEALKATNAQLVLAQFPRDMKGGAGDGCLLVFGAQSITEVRKAVEICLNDLARTFGELYRNSAGHIQLQYSSHVGEACKIVYGARADRSFGVITGAPASIGIVMADAAMKSADIEIIDFALPSQSSFANESTLTLSGDAGAVCHALLAAKEVGLTVLNAMSKQPARSMGEPYISL